MAPLSIGSQTNGSIIRPASYCGVVGYKPSFGLISRNGVLKTSDNLDHVGVFGKSVEDVALLSKVLIKKDSYDKATIHYSTETMMEEYNKGPLYDPKFIFYKTESWKKIDKKSRDAFEFFIKSFKKILKYLIPHLISKILKNIIKLFMKLIWQTIFKIIIKKVKINYLKKCNWQLQGE